MNELQEMLERQARWQQAQRSLSWPEKIRMAEAAREGIAQLRASARCAGQDKVNK
ncbi:MAG: hypothetical protein M3P06_20155 [Acidobacteriota bacterium]|nr:hypothetical protein [Acidobacteriota bacterium]